MIKDIGKFLGYFFIIIGCSQLVMIFINEQISEPLPLIIEAEDVNET